MITHEVEQRARTRAEARNQKQLLPTLAETDLRTEQSRRLVLKTLLTLAEPHERPAILATMQGQKL